ncbi:MAG: helix-turn-helix transcriptional regulator [Lachnospiraceae bacterium]|jgi:AraC family transcriptional regulator of arabinose operon|nr:helix-turn-helix transcriptional regulator [Lachnospiraceae bacterium]
MKLGTIGYNYSHEDTFMMDRPDGIGCGVMLLVKTPARFNISHINYDIRQKSIVILSPEAPHYYRALEGVYTDDWMYFTWEDGDYDMFKELGIPLDMPIPLKNPDELSFLYKSIAYEHYSNGAFHDEICANYLQILLYKLAWNAGNMKNVGRPLSKKNTDALMHIRNKIFDFPEEIRDVGYYADSLNMSMSGFQHAYKKLFGVSLMTDINNSRFGFAKQLLLATDMHLKEIADKCGYESEYSFMRQFKKMFGKTPTEFRRQI